MFTIHYQTKKNNLLIFFLTFGEACSTTGFTIIHAAHTIKNRVNKSSQVVVLSDALSALQAFRSGKTQHLEKAMYQIKTLRTVLQWIPSHCGVEGNEKADDLAKARANQDQENNPVSLKEMNTIIKSLYKTPLKPDAYHQLSRLEQVIIFRLRTGHNRLNKHLHTKLKVVPSPMCSCGQSEQDTTHILQECRDLVVLRKKVWPEPVPIERKLHGCVDDLQKTARFILRANLQV